MPTVTDLKYLLSSLDYEKIEFIGFGDYDGVVYFDAFIDTYYRVMCKIRTDGVIEVHDTTFDVNNYVLIARVNFDRGSWLVLHH